MTEVKNGHAIGYHWVVGTELDLLHKGMKGGRLAGRIRTGCSTEDLQGVAGEI